MDEEYENMSDELVAAVEAALKDRYRNGVMDSEVDFLCGAMVAAQALGHWPPPPLWVFSPMRGESVLEGQTLKDTVEVEVMRCESCNEPVPVSTYLRIGSQEWELEPAWDAERVIIHDDGICDECVVPEEVSA